VRRLLVAAALAVAVLPSTAVAGPPNTVSGFLCGFSSLSDPNQANTLTGEVDGGPLAAADLPVYEDGWLTWHVAANPVRISMTCTLQAWGFRHSDPDAFAATSPLTPGVTVLPPTPFTVPDGDPYTLYILCTSAYVEEADGAAYTLYYDSASGGGTDSWTTDANAACDNPFAPPPADPLDEVFDLLNATVCPILGLVPGVGHDLQVLWEDCEPWM
jgi:hypothetical protein